MPAWMTSELRELVSVPMPSAASTTMTSRPARASARATARQAEALVGRCRAPGVKLVCLVNNASLFKLDRAPTATAADFDLHVAVNLRAPLLLSQALTRQLPKGCIGLIVNLEDQKLFNLN